MLNLSALDDSDWQEFERDHPDAYQWLVQRQLANELTALETIRSTGYPLNEWQQRRLAQLAKLFGAQVAVGVEDRT